MALVLFGFLGLGLPSFSSQCLHSLPSARAAKDLHFGVFGRDPQLPEAKTLNPTPYLKPGDQNPSVLPHVAARIHGVRQGSQNQAPERAGGGASCRKLERVVYSCW